MGPEGPVSHVISLCPLSHKLEIFFLSLISKRKIAKYFSFGAIILQSLLISWLASTFGVGQMVGNTLGFNKEPPPMAVAAATRLGYAGQLMDLCGQYNGWSQPRMDAILLRGANETIALGMQPDKLVKVYDIGAAAAARQFDIHEVNTPVLCRNAETDVLAYARSLGF